MLEIGIRLAYASVNVCVHSSTVRQNRAVFGYVLAIIHQYGSGEPLWGIGGVGTAPYGPVRSRTVPVHPFQGSTAQCGAALGGA